MSHADSIFSGHIENGKVVLDDPVSLPEGAVVQVILLAQDVPLPADGVPSLSETLLKFAGKLSGLPADFSAQHDHYIHGVPKQ